MMRMMKTVRFFNLRVCVSTNIIPREWKESINKYQSQSILPWGQRCTRNIPRIGAYGLLTVLYLVPPCWEGDNEYDGDGRNNDDDIDFGDSNFAHFANFASFAMWEAMSTEWGIKIAPIPISDVWWCGCALTIENLPLQQRVLDYFSIGTSDAIAVLLVHWSNIVLEHWPMASKEYWSIIPGMI